MGAMLRWFAVLPGLLLSIITNTQAAAPGALSVQSWASKLDPVVGESVVITVRLYSLGNPRHVELHRPELENASLDELQGPVSGMQVVNGTPLITNDFQYLLVPRAPGAFKLGPFHLRVIAADGRLWRTGAMPQGLEVESEAIGLTVHPVATEAGDRLPATSLKMSARVTDPWLAENAEALSYQVTTVVRGAGGDRIPAAALPEQTRDFSIRVTDSQTETRVLPNGYGVEGTRVDTFELTPRRQGQLTIPGVEVFWWNTALEEEESTVLPATRLQVGKPQRPDDAASADEDFSPLSDRLHSEHAFQHFLMPLALGLILAIMVGLWICGPGFHRADR